MRLIVGLGNPGIRYAGTRHNIGFEVVDRFARRHGARLRRRWCRSLVADLRIRGEEFLLAKPQTFMNLSGEAVRELLLRTKAAAADMLVVCDDINLPLGRIRLRRPAAPEDITGWSPSSRASALRIFPGCVWEWGRATTGRM